MGKWRQGKDKDAGWDYWHGSWSASPGQGGRAPWKQKEGPSPGPSIAAYDAKKALPEQSNPGQYALPLDRNATLVQDLQRAVNSARKAEQRVKKIQMEKAERQSQWRNWEAELRRTFSKEKGRYVAALGRLDQEMTEALTQQEKARELLRSAASGQEVSRGEENQMAMDSEFDELMRADSWDADMSQDAVLQRALAETMAVPPAAPMVTPTRATAAAPRTPRHGSAGPLSAAPTTTSASSRMRPFPPPVVRQAGGAPSVSPPRQPAVEDPYLAAQASRGTGGMLRMSQVGGTPSPTHAPPRTPKQRQSVKESSKPQGPVHGPNPFPTFQEKMDERRASLTAQIVEHAAPQSFCIFNDDEDTGPGPPAASDVTANLMD